MAYFLKKSKLKKGLYLQIYFSYHDPKTQQSRHRSYRPVGYVHELQEQGIGDPISYFQEEVDELNKAFHKEKEKEKTRLISDVTPVKHLGYSIAKNVNDSLGVRHPLELMQRAYGLRYNAYDLLASLVYARLCEPCSKYKTFHDVLPQLFDSVEISIDQLYTSLDFFGNEYEKIIEAYNDAIDRKYPFQMDQSYFDGTNFYFEIDREDDWRRKGPSKENRHDPIMGMGLLLDARQVPMGMTLYPGNQSERPVQGKLIRDIQSRMGFEGRTIRIADKGLNCAKNIHEALKDGDGYLYSKSVKTLPEQELDWILNEQDYREVRDREGKILYVYKSCIDTFSYSYRDESGQTIRFSIDEKRIVTYNPSLARKQREEMKRQVDKARTLCHSQAKRENFGDKAKYLLFEAADENGELSSGNVAVSMNQELIEKHLRLAGYNLLVCSELKMHPQEIYRIYHNLWRIEESFRMMKSELEARPVFLQKPERIHAHFLICYLAVVLVRLLQIEIFKDDYSYQDIIGFMREFKLTQLAPRKFVNMARSSPFINDLTERTGLPFNQLYLNNTKVRSILNYRF